MRWRKISSDTVKLDLENPDKIESKSENDFIYIKNIDDTNYKVFCIVVENKYVIKSAIKK